MEARRGVEVADVEFDCLNGVLANVEVDLALEERGMQRRQGPGRSGPRWRRSWRCTRP